MAIYDNTATFGIPADYLKQDLILNEDDLDIDNVLSILQEECAELIKASSKFMRGETITNEEVSVSKLVEEMAHVAICMGLFAKKWDIKREQIISEVDKKAEEYGVKYKKTYSFWELEKIIDFDKIVAKELQSDSKTYEKWSNLIAKLVTFYLEEELKKIPTKSIADVSAYAFLEELKEEV
jgi:NTP pyrophosphatase (non-canonical NTP hydrolase)